MDKCGVTFADSELDYEICWHSPYSASEVEKEACYDTEDNGDDGEGNKLGRQI